MVELDQARDELFALARADLPEATPGSAPWQAVAISCGIRALKFEAPPHGMSNLSRPLASYTKFDEAIMAVLRILDQCTGIAARGLAVNAIFGPWEGGFLIDTAPSSAHSACLLNLKLVAWNARGGLSPAGSVEAHNGRILKFVNQLHNAKCSLCVLSEPRFGPGMIWPSWSGYDWVGCRSCASDTVAVLISEELSDKFIQLPNIGDERAIWLCVNCAEPGKEEDLPSLLILAVYALTYGYDLAWKPAVLLHTRWAGVSGAFWLCLDSALCQDQFRVKYGPLISPTLLLLAAGLGQGGRRAVHLFGALARGIPDELRKLTIGVALGTSRLLLDALQLNQRLSGDVCWMENVRLVSHFRELGVSSLNLPPAAPSVPCSVESALLAVDALAQHSLLVSHFVDDVFVLQSTLWGIQRACRALDNFCNQWRHRFATGKSKVSLMPVSPFPFHDLIPPSLGDSEVEWVVSCQILGPIVDLSLLRLLESICGRL
eukprot:s593_g16.t1